MNTDQDFNLFLRWEAATRDVMMLRKVYVDMTGDLVAGLMLSQIIYWHLPGRDGKSRLRVAKEGGLWLAKSYSDWWDEIRVTEKQARRAVNVLREKGLVITGVWKFNGTPTVHLRIDEARFLEAWKAAVENPGGKSICPGGQVDLPPGASPSALGGKSITETTTESTQRLQHDQEDLPFSVEEIWNQAKKDLALQMTKATFDYWLKASRGVSLEDHVLTVGVATEAAVEWCTHRMGKMIARTVAEVAGDAVEVRFVVV